MPSSVLSTSIGSQIHKKNIKNKFEFESLPNDSNLTADFSSKSSNIDCRITFVEPNDIKKTETTEINKFLKLDTPSCKSFTLLNQAYVFPTSLEESVSKFQKFDGNKFFKKLQISFYLLILYKL